MLFVLLINFLNRKSLLMTKKFPNRKNYNFENIFKRNFLLPLKFMYINRNKINFSKSNQIINFFLLVHLKWSVIYRASQDGFKAISYVSILITLIIIKSSNGNVFGARLNNDLISEHVGSIICRDV